MENSLRPAGELAARRADGGRSSSDDSFALGGEAQFLVERRQRQCAPQRELQVRRVEDMRRWRSDNWSEAADLFGIDGDRQECEIRQSGVWKVTSWRPRLTPISSMSATSGFHNLGTLARALLTGLDMTNWLRDRVAIDAPE